MVYTNCQPSQLIGPVLADEFSNFMITSDLCTFFLIIARHKEEIHGTDKQTVAIHPAA